MSSYGGSIAPPIVFVIIFVIVVTIVYCRRRAVRVRDDAFLSGVQATCLFVAVLHQMLRQGLIPSMWGFAQPRHTVVMVAQPGQYPNVPAGAMVVHYPVQLVSFLHMSARLPPFVTICMKPCVIAYRLQ
jgi:hypothetical protein